MNDQIPETKVLTEEEQIQQLLEHLPAEADISVTVPSLGLPYFGKEGTIQIRPMTFDDEKTLTTGVRTPQFNAANFLLERCVLNVKTPHLLLMDKLFLLLKIREISYGNDYKIKVGCSKCQFENELNLLLDQLRCVFVDKDMNFADRTVFLEGLKKEATVSVLTVSDEDILQRGDIYSNLYRFIKTLDSIDNPGIIQKVISKLPIADIHCLMNALTLSDYGIQPQVRYVCDACNHSNLISLPIDENFFSVN